MAGIIGICIFKRVNTIGIASCMIYDWDMEIQKHGQMKTQ